jgi:tRNA pseudouridine38-40 synthase
MGALLAVGEGRRQVTWPGSLLTRNERACEVMVAPPHGLTLVEVCYPSDEAGYAERSAQTRRRRDALD